MSFNESRMKTTLFLAVLTAVHLHVGLARADDGYTAHEWGTFTSVQAFDGIQLEWNPLSVSELPKFVYNRTTPGGASPAAARPYLAGKGDFSALQRMETPVIYFYSQHEQTVDVTVQFPQGIVTEWYPQLRASAQASTNLLNSPRTVRWDQVRVLPAERHADLSALLPSDPSGSHYYAARATDAAFLQVNPDSQAKERLETAKRLFSCAAPSVPSSPVSKDRLETEKFLFYRGVGNFRAPLTVTQAGQDAQSVQLRNTGADELRHLFVYVARGQQGKFVFVAELPPGASRLVDLSPDEGLAPLSETRARIAVELQEGLVREGLFPMEAQAMVKTWDDSWFAESGVRVLYTLPRAWTDRILPLTLDPQPREVVRVMVGRAELITPSMEWELMKQIVRYTDPDGSVRTQAIQATRNLGLGRFLEPAARRLQIKVPTQELGKASAELIRAASKPGVIGKDVAVK